MFYIDNKTTRIDKIIEKNSKQNNDTLHSSREKEGNNKSSNVNRNIDTVPGDPVHQPIGSRMWCVGTMLLLLVAIPPPSVHAESSAQWGSISQGGEGKAVSSPRRWWGIPKRVWPFSSTASSQWSHLQILEDQKKLLERQLRQNQDEMFQLRNQMKRLQQANTAWMRIRSKNESDNQMEMDFLKEEVARLEEEINNMERIKIELEQLLESEKQNVAQLQRLLEDARNSGDALRVKYEWEIEELRKQMDIKLRQKIDELNDLMEKRLKETIEAERKSAEVEKKAAIEEAKRIVQTDADKRISEAQRKAADAVEQEKIKMRKLVKALAEREKKLFAESASDRKAARISNGVTSNKRTRKPDVVRGPLKSKD